MRTIFDCSSKELWNGCENWIWCFLIWPDEESMFVVNNLNNKTHETMLEHDDMSTDGNGMYSNGFASWLWFSYEASHTNPYTYHNKGMLNFMHFSQNKPHKVPCSSKMVRLTLINESTSAWAKTYLSIFAITCVYNAHILRCV